MGAGAEGGEGEDSVVVVVRVQYTYRRCSVDPDGGKDKEDEKKRSYCRRRTADTRLLAFSDLIFSTLHVYHTTVSVFPRLARAKDGLCARPALREVVESLSEHV